MNDKEDELAERWKQARAAALADPLFLTGDICMKDLAQWTGLSWFRTIGDHPVAFYLGRNFRELTELYGFGAKKRARLVALVEASTAPTFERPSPARVELSVDPCIHLEAWGVNESYPISVLPLPTRALKFCESENVLTLTELLAIVAERGERELLKQRNLGRKSVDQMLDLVNAIRRCDKDRARQWLPLAEDDQLGLSLRVGIRRLVADLDSRQRPLLERRFGQGLTLEESAQALGLTRERVRQIARDFLIEPMKRLMFAHEKEHATLFQKWLDGSSASIELGPFNSSSEAAMVDGALTEIFLDTPEAIAARLDQEILFETCIEQLKASREFHQNGVELQSFLDERLQTRLHTAFTAFLFQKPGLSIDHNSGLIAPERPSLRKLVHCIIADEQDPISATWLMRLIQEAKAFKSLGIDDLRSRFRGWIQHYPDFPKDRILWNE